MNRKRICRRSRPARRRGAVLILTALLMVFLMALLAFSVDLGYMYTVRTELQRSADASAIAAAWELLDEQTRLANGDLSEAAVNAQLCAQDFAARNQAGQVAPSLGQEDVTVGYRSNIFDMSEPISTSPLNLDLNTVHVRVQRSGAQNGEVPLFFAPVLGFDTTAIDAEATAALVTAIKGFKAPGPGQTLHFLPLALDEETFLQWNMDPWSFPNEWAIDGNGTITSGADGVPELNLYPQDTGAPGNRGTVDVGNANNSTADISRQIMEGLSDADLEPYNGELKLDQNGELFLNGDTGISAGIKDELAAIKGRPSVIPIFRTVTGNGNNATYTIIGFMGVCITDVKLTGPMSKKHVTIQPASVLCRGIIPADAGTAPSHFVYSPVVLVQ